MKFIKLFSLSFLLLFFVKVTAQEFKLGKVSIAELQQTVHPKDTAAAAAILYKKGSSSIEFDPNEGFITTTEVEIRIKIYKKNGYDWANHEVWYYNNSDLSEKVSISDAVTYNLVAGKIEKTKLKSEGIFTEAVNKYRGQKKITMPNVKEGSVIEFKYSIRSPSRIIRDWNFQSSIPVNYSQFVTYIPEYYTFNARQKGYIFPKVTTVKKDKSILLTSKERNNYGGGNGRVVGTDFSTDKVNYMEIQTTYVGQDLPAMKDEAFVNNIDNYTASIEHELSMVQFPNSPIKAYSTDWNSVVKTIYDYESFGPELNKTGYFEDDVKKLIAGLNTTEEKILTIFNYVKSTVK